MLSPADALTARPLAPIEAPNPLAGIPDSRQDAYQRALGRIVGQQLQGEVMSRFKDGSYMVKVADTAARMSLPPGTQVGDQMSLKLVALQPRATFLLGNPNGEGSSVVLSRTTLEDFDQHPGLLPQDGKGAAPNGAHAAPGGQLRGNPLVYSGPQTAAQQKNAAEAAKALLDPAAGAQDDAAGQPNPAQQGANGKASITFRSEPLVYQRPLTPQQLAARLEAANQRSQAQTEAQTAGQTAGQAAGQAAAQTAGQAQARAGGAETAARPAAAVPGSTAAASPGTASATDPELTPAADPHGAPVPQPTTPGTRQAPAQAQAQAQIQAEDQAKAQAEAQAKGQPQAEAAAGRNGAQMAQARPGGSPGAAQRADGAAPAASDAAAEAAESQPEAAPARPAAAQQQQIINKSVLMYLNPLQQLAARQGMAAAAAAMGQPNAAPAPAPALPAAAAAEAAESAAPAVPPGEVDAPSETHASAGQAPAGAATQKAEARPPPIILSRASLFAAQAPPSPGSMAGSAPASLSSAARLIGNLLQTAQNAPTAILGKAAIVSSPTAGAEKVASALHDTLEYSGLFYESHVVEWAGGKRPLTDLQREPQMRLGLRTAESPSEQLHLLPGGGTPPNAGAKAIPLPAAPGPAEQPNAANAAIAANAGVPSATPDMAARPDANNAQLAQLINLQLNTLEQQRTQWHGEVWPGQPMEWEVKKEERQGGQGQPGEEQSWISSVRFSLPTLGSVAATVRLVGGHVQVQVSTASEETAASLRAHAGVLAGALEAAGSVLDSLIVKQDDRPKQ